MTYILTKNFHNDKFPGWKPNFSFEDIEKNPLDATFPYVELDFKWDVSEIEKELTSKDTQELFIPVQTGKRAMKRKWYEREDEYGWFEIRIIGPAPSLTDWQTETLEKPREFICRSDALQKTQKFFHDKGLFFTRLVAVKLLPGGYCYPHTDARPRADAQPEKNLECFWIPINHCQDNCKTYPYGYMPHRVGSMFLLNNKQYWHSVMNKDTYPRYVLTGRIDSLKSNFDINFVKDSIKKQWYS